MKHIRYLLSKLMSDLNVCQWLNLLSKIFSQVTIFYNQVLVKKGQKVNWSSLLEQQQCSTWCDQSTVGAIPHEIKHTICALLVDKAMCIHSVWHCTIIYSTMCVYASWVVAWLKHSNWFVLSSPPSLLRTCESALYSPVYLILAVENCGLCMRQCLAFSNYRHVTPWNKDFEGRPFLRPF